MSNSAIENPGRRFFLRTASVAAAAGFALADASTLIPSAAAQGSAATGNKYQIFTADALEEDIKALHAAPGNKNLIEEKSVVAMLTTERTKAAAEFEWHEHRDHIFHILDGSAIYELGGTPKRGRQIRPGEWLAPESDGATKLTVKKGDMLFIPRGTPHKRTTPDSVTFTLISPQGEA